MGLPFVLFADSITLFAHAPSSGFGPLIGTNEWNHFRAACTMIRTEYDLFWLTKRSWQKHSYRPWPERRPNSKAWQQWKSGKKQKKSRPLQGNDQIYALFSLFFFNTASNNIGISCPSVSSCQALDSHSYTVSSSLHRCSFFSLYSFFSPVFLLFFLVFFSILLPYFAFPYPLLCLSLLLVSAIAYLFFCMPMRSSFIPQNKPVSMTLPQP